MQSKLNCEKIASNFLELASEQRVEILSSLNEKKSRVASMAKKLKVTSQEIHRNYDRLSESGFITKRADGCYHITNLGKIICSQIPVMNFVANNEGYFKYHFFGKLPTKFIHRIGELNNCSQIEGVTRVLDKWRQIYKNSDKYVFDIVSESPLRIEEPLMDKVKNGIKYCHLFDQNMKEPRGREKFLKDNDYYDLIQKDKIERRKGEKIDTIVILNEKEGGVIFPNTEGEPDLRYMFYGNDPAFLGWCKDYFDYLWSKSKPVKKIPPIPSKVHK